MSHLEYIIIPKLRCLSCEGTPTIAPDENQSPEEAALQHLVLHKDDVDGPHEIASRYILGEVEVEDQ